MRGVGEGVYGLRRDWGTWKTDGVTIKKGDEVKPFQPAATFEDGEYKSKKSGNHAVIVLDNSPGGLVVFDQYSGKDAGVRTLSYQGGRSSEANKALIAKGEAEAAAAIEKGLIEADSRDTTGRSTSTTTPATTRTTTRTSRSERRLRPREAFLESSQFTYAFTFRAIEKTVTLIS